MAVILIHLGHGIVRRECPYCRKRVEKCVCKKGDNK